MKPTGTLIDQMPSNSVVRRSKALGTKRCLSCGTDRIEPRRRYCSNGCRRQMTWVLSLSKGLLKAINARYAAFSFTEKQVVLDVFPVWSKEVSRFSSGRRPGNRPAEDLKALILQSGKEWHRMVSNNHSRSFASLFLLNKNHKKEIDPEKIMPLRKTSPRLSRHEKDCLKVLHLDRKDLVLKDGNSRKIRSAYKKLAKLHHPDKGGDEERFKQLNEAHKQMLLWTENPQFTCRKALQGCWSYDSATNRWAPPL